MQPSASGVCPQRGLLLGFTAARAICIALAVTVVSSAVFLEGATGLAILAPVWVALLALAFVSYGRPVAVELAPTLGHFLARRATGRTVSGPTRPHRVRPGRWPFPACRALDGSNIDADPER